MITQPNLAFDLATRRHMSHYDWVTTTITTIHYKKTEEGEKEVDKNTDNSLSSKVDAVGGREGVVLVEDDGATDVGVVQLQRQLPRPRVGFCHDSAHHTGGGYRLGCGHVLNRPKHPKGHERKPLFFFFFLMNSTTTL